MEKKKQTILRINGGPKVDEWLRITQYAKATGLTRAGVYYRIQKGALQVRTLNGIFQVRDK